jgi:hypothetical protein
MAKLNLLGQHLHRKGNVREVLAVNHPSQGISRQNDCKTTAHQTTPLTAQTEQGTLQNQKK